MKFLGYVGIPDCSLFCKFICQFISFNSTMCWYPIYVYFIFDLITVPVLFDFLPVWVKVLVK